MWDAYVSAGAPAHRHGTRYDIFKVSERVVAASPSRATTVSNTAEPLRMAGKSAPDASLVCAASAHASLPRLCPRALVFRHWLTTLLRDRRLEFSLGVNTTLSSQWLPSTSSTPPSMTAVVPAAVAFIRAAVIAAIGVVPFVLVILVLLPRPL